MKTPDCGKGALRATLTRRLQGLRPKPTSLFVVLDPGATEVAERAVRLAAKDAGMTATFVRGPHGESRKTLASAEKLAGKLIRKGLDRRAFVLAVGGGVCTDVTGFVASSIMRGVRWGVAPTTLLAMVDAAVGGKTAVNLEEGKNLFGAFHFPSFLIIDTNLLRTLPAREWRSGRGELVKTAMLCGGAMWRSLCSASGGSLARRSEALTTLVHKAARYKAKVVAQDPQEQEERKLLNLGHTFGHALETAMGPRRLRHGEAVALGVLCAVKVAVENELAPASTEADMRTLFTRHDLPTELKGPLPNATTLRRLLSRDKKADDGLLQLVVPLAPGEVVLVKGVAVQDAVGVLRRTLG
jgi:3-dehydroquinate synthase